MHTSPWPLILAAEQLARNAPRGAERLDEVLQEFTEWILEKPLPDRQPRHLKPESFLGSLFLWEAIQKTTYTVPSQGRAEAMLVTHAILAHHPIMRALWHLRLLDDWNTEGLHWHGTDDWDETGRTNEQVFVDSVAAAWPALKQLLCSRRASRLRHRKLRPLFPLRKDMERIKQTKTASPGDQQTFFMATMPLRHFVLDMVDSLVTVLAPPLRTLVASPTVIHLLKTETNSLEPVMDGDEAFQEDLCVVAAMRRIASGDMSWVGGVLLSLRHWPERHRALWFGAVAMAAAEDFEAIATLKHGLRMPKFPKNVRWPAKHALTRQERMKLKGWLHNNPGRLVAAAAKKVRWLGRKHGEEVVRKAERPTTLIAKGMPRLARIWLFRDLILLPDIHPYQFTVAYWLWGHNKDIDLCPGNVDEVLKRVDHARHDIDRKLRIKR